MINVGRIIGNITSGISSAFKGLFKGKNVESSESGAKRTEAQSEYPSALSAHSAQKASSPSVLQRLFTKKEPDSLQETMERLQTVVDVNKKMARTKRKDAETYKNMTENPNSRKLLKLNLKLAKDHDNMANNAEKQLNALKKKHNVE